MTGLLKKILPFAGTITKDDHDDDNNVEYSFAMEYQGPPVAYDIPRVVPVRVNQIPIAATVASASILNDMSLPIIQPIVKTRPLNKKLPKEPQLGTEANSCPNSGTPSSELVCSGITGFSKGCNLYCESPNEIDSSGALVSINDDECMPKLSDGIGSSGMLQFSDSHNNLCESSGKLGVSELPDDCKEGSGFQSYMNPTNCESTGSGSSSRALSSEIFSCKEEDCNNDIPGHVKRPSVVTFRDPESRNVVHEESDHFETESINVRPKAERNGKKGSCYRCLRGNRFTEKEVCIVCGAKYCCNCVLRAMGSMPEGRKCVTCIGFRIDELKRGTLGKCSRMLRRLLTELEVKQIMHSEISCIANQLPPELVYVNGELLSQEELFLLQNCPNPPTKLKPGYYWYDKVSGFWGKEGQKPCQIISPQLNVGGHIKKDASNGNTDIMINNRVITKAELFMLKMVGVQCEGKPHLWVSADGSYQEEGMKNVKGRIWGKTRTKLVCVALSLPFPSDSMNLSGEDVNGVSPNYHEQKALHKLLLVGYEKSGTSTIYKQAKILYNIPFSEDERQNIKLMIQSNLYGYLGILLEGRERFEEECLIEKGKSRFIDQSGPSGNNGQMDNGTIYSIRPRLKAFSDWLLKVMVSGNLEAIFSTAIREYAPFVEELWNDAAFQATYNRRSELEMLPRVATYFLERALEISRTDYEPSDIDILYAEGITSCKGLSCMEFSFPKSTQESCIDPADLHDPSLRCQLIRVHPRSLGENCKWLEMFEDVDLVLFCVSLADYNEFSKDINGVLTNKMLASKRLFESIITHPIFEQKDFLLILNKFDLFEEKIDRVPLTRCEWFNDFNPLISDNHNSTSRNSNPSLAHRAFQYIAVKFKRLFRSLTDGKLYVSMATGLEPDSVDEALRYASAIVKWNEEEPALNLINELSSTDIEASSSS